MNKLPGPNGTQVVSRITTLLRAVGDAMPTGTDTSTLAHGAAISRPTTHRLLSALHAQGFLDRDRATGHWVLGPELYLLGSVAAQRFDIADHAREIVRSLAHETGESAFFSVRRGNETVCLLREEGSFPIRSFVLHEGKRFPIGVASAGLAILSYLPDTEITQYLTHAPLSSEYGNAHDNDAIWERVRHTRNAGYAVNPELITEGSWGMGAAVFDHRGAPAWALSITGITHRFSEARQPELGRTLLAHAHQLTQRLRDRG